MKLYEIRFSPGTEEDVNDLMEDGLLPSTFRLSLADAKAYVRQDYQARAQRAKATELPDLHWNEQDEGDPNETWWEAWLDDELGSCGWCWRIWQTELPGEANARP